VISLSVPTYPNLLKLSLEDVSQAWEFLKECADSNQLLTLPPNLQHLSLEEWHLLERLLQQEMYLKSQHPLQ